MGVILMRAACFIAVIVLGHILRRTGFFKEEDFHVLSKIVLKITLPTAIISSVSGSKIDPSLLVICLLGFGGGLAVYDGFISAKSALAEGKESL